MATAKYILCIVQNTKVVQVPRIYTEQKQYFTSQQLFKVVPSRLKFFLPHFLSDLFHTSDSVDGDLSP